MPRRRQELKVKEFHESLNREFYIIKDRVRFLIGDSHWGEDGRYKEVLLKNFLRRYLPKHLSVGSGFIMNNDNYDSISTQIDIVIYENEYPLIFKEDDFVIINSKSVVGVIEVKSRYDASKFEEVIEKSQEITGLVERPIFNGIFENVLSFV